MKKLLLSLVAVVGFAVASNAQHCGVSSCTTQTFDSAGLYPVSDSLPCFVRGQAVDQTIFFQNYSTYSLSGTQLTVDSIRIDSILLTPGVCNNGLFWAMNNASNVVAGGASGCINVSGTVSPTIPAGQYKLHIAVNVWVSQSGQQISPTGIAYTSEGLGLNYYIRIIDADSACVAVDTAGAPAFVSYYGEALPSDPGQCALCTSGINDIATNVSQLTVQPNPFGTATTITFSAENRENYAVKLTNLLGEVVYAKDVVANAGRNSFAVENKGYSNGVYLLSLTNGKSTITKRVVISE